MRLLTLLLFVALARVGSAMLRRVYMPSAGGGSMTFQKSQLVCLNCFEGLGGGVEEASVTCESGSDGVEWTCRHMPRMHNGTVICTALTEEAGSMCRLLYRLGEVPAMRLADVSMLSLSSRNTTVGRRLAEAPQVRQRGAGNRYSQDVRAACVRTGMSDRGEAAWECEFTRNAGPWASSRRLEVEDYGVTCEAYAWGDAAHIVAGSCRVEFSPAAFWSRALSYFVRGLVCSLAMIAVSVVVFASFMYDSLLIKSS